VPTFVDRHPKPDSFWGICPSIKISSYLTPRAMLAIVLKLKPYFFYLRVSLSRSSNAFQYLLENRTNSSSPPLFQTIELCNTRRAPHTPPSSEREEPSLVEETDWTRGLAEERNQYNPSCFKE